jgi:hypothetical protein
MRRILLVVLGLVLGIALGEVGLRLATVVSRPSADGFKLADPVLHYRLRPNTTTVFTSDEYRVEIRTNSLGFHDYDYPAAKPVGTFRVLMLGDSGTFGTGLRLEETGAKRAERLLRETCSRSHEVINAGVPSYSPLLEYLLLKHIGLGLHPDLVVLNFDMTDVRDDFIRTALARLDSDGLPLAVPPNHFLETALLIPPLPKPRFLWIVEPVEAVVRRSALYQALRKSRPANALLGPLRLDPRRLEALGLVGDIQYDRMAITRGKDNAKLRAAWVLTERYIVGIRDLARTRNILFVLVVYPHAYQVSASESQVGQFSLGVGPSLVSSERPFQILDELGRRHGFPVVNLLALFRERHDTEGRLFWHDNMHFNPRGARVFAEGTVSGLRQLDLLPHCARR